MCCQPKPENTRKRLTTRESYIHTVERECVGNASDVRTYTGANEAQSYLKTVTDEDEGEINEFFSKITADLAKSSRASDEEGISDFNVFV